VIDRATLTHKPVLVGERIRLVPLGPQHAEALHASTRDPEVRRLTGTHTDFTLEQIRAWCAGRAEQDDRIDWAIEDRVDGEFLGEIVLLDVDPVNETAGLRIALAPAAQGRGYGPEAIRLVLDHAFTVVRLHRVQLEVFAFNERAIRAYRRCGFQVEGRLRQVLLWEGERHDALVMSVLAPEAAVAGAAQK